MKWNKVRQKSFVLGISRLTCMWYVHTFYTDCGLVSPFLVISANYYMSTSSYCKFLSSRGSWYYLVVGLVAKRMWNILVFEVSESWRWDLGTKKKSLEKKAIVVLFFMMAFHTAFIVDVREAHEHFWGRRRTQPIFPPSFFGASFGLFPPRPLTMHF